MPSVISPDDEGDSKAFSRPVIDEDDDDEPKVTTNKQRIEKPQETIVVVVVVAVVVVVVAVVVVVVHARLSFAFECVFMCVNLCGTKRCKNEEERADRRERQPFEEKCTRERESVGG